MTATTTRSDQEDDGDVITSYAAAPTRTISVGGVDFAYRELGPATGVPVVFLTHLAAVLDNWDPRVVDGIAAQHRVITFDNRGVGASGGSTPDTIEAMAHGRGRLHPGAGSRAGRPPRLLDGRHDRPADRRGRTAARPQGHPRRHRSRRRRGDHEGDPDRAPRHAARAAHLAGPEAVPLLHPDTRGASSRQGVPGPPEGAHRATATSASRCGPTAPSSRPSTAGASSRPPTSRSSTSRSSSPTARPTGWSRRATRSIWPQRLPNAELVIYPDAGHGGIFQFHQQFVERALAFLGENS